MEHVFNPYLPLTEHIPDGEPHLFGDRVYIYGSHDKPEGTVYCADHYTVWSAPKEDLRCWRCEGTSYMRTQDPSNADDSMQLWAPDVTQGPDGRYYLYYCFSFYPEIGVAVSDNPAGPFEFYGHIKYPASIRDGAVLREFMPFDPAVLTDDDGRVYLYYGFCPAEEKEMQTPDPEELKNNPDIPPDMLQTLLTMKFGEYSMVAELEPDMITLKEVPRELIPGGHHTAGTGFEGHGFFEASSIRKIHGKYYFVYSSHRSHELCYAVSDHPDRGFVYGGTIVSNGDIGLNGRTAPVNALGNNHGGIVQVGEDFYIFYHRQTNGTEFSRQGCAEKLTILPDGSIPQAEITSCGLNGGPLTASGTYPAAIACHLTDPTTKADIDYFDPIMAQQVRVTEQQSRVYITGIKDQTVIGYKYFDFKDANTILAELKGQFKGQVAVALDPDGTEIIGTAALSLAAEQWSSLPISVSAAEGTHALYFIFTGEGMCEFKSFTFAAL